MTQAVLTGKGFPYCSEREGGLVMYPLYRRLFFAPPAAPCRAAVTATDGGDSRRDDWLEPTLWPVLLRCQDWWAEPRPGAVC